MTKKYQIFELNEHENNVFKTSEPTEYNLRTFDGFDTLEEAEEAIKKYGDDYVNYIIQPIYRIR